MLTALGNQFRVLGVLVRRDLDEKFSRGGVIFLFQLLEPMLQIMMITAFFELLKLTPTYGPSIALFAATGFFPFYIYVHLSLRFRSAFSPVMGRRRIPMETSLDLMLAKSFIHLATYLLTGLVLFSLIYAYETTLAAPHDPWMVFKAIVALVIIGFGIGLCNPIISYIFPLWNFVYSAVARILGFLSAILFVADFLPLYLREWIAWNPLAHAVTMFRKGFYPGYPSLVFSEAYLWGTALAIVTVGLCLQRIFRQILSS
jgi:capsular polysaccharide transport system permease protein